MSSTRSARKWKSRNSRVQLTGALLALALAASACGGDGEGDQTDEASGGEEDSGDEGAYYAGREISWLIPSSAGGGTDAMVRWMAPFLEKHLEGNPSVQAFNEENTVAAMNNFMRESNESGDGTNIVMTSTSSTLPYILGGNNVEYDLSELEPLIGSPVGAVVYTSENSALDEASDIFDEEAILGLETVIGGETQTLVGLETLGADFSPIFGYTSAGAFRIALEQGEINLTYDTSPAYLTEVEPGDLDVRPLFTLGFLDDGELVRDPLFPDLPHIAEVYEEEYGSPPSGPAWDAYMTLAPTRFVLNKGVWVNKNAPEEAKTALREAFASMLEDPEFMETKEDIVGPYDLVYDGIDQAVQNITNLDSESQSWLVDYLVDNYDANL